MTVHLRPFVPADYPRYLELSNAVYPEYRQSMEEFRHDDDAWDAARYHKLRLVAEDAAGRLVGGGVVAHMPAQFHPDKYGLFVHVHPDHRRRGIGSALYERLMGELGERGAVVARTEVKESMADGVAFATRRGFVEMKREWESRLDVAGFDWTRFAGAAERAAAAGIAITTLAAERARHPDAVRAAYELNQACERDVPEVDPVTPVPFDQFVKQEVEGPSALADGYFLAKDGDRYVGQSNLFSSAEEPDVLYQGLTGVLPEYRGKGIALALKLRTVAYARDHDKREIRTWNDTRNRPMLRINEAMGFVKQPAWIVFQKTLEASEAAGGRRQAAGARSPEGKSSSE